MTLSWQHIKCHHVNPFSNSVDQRTTFMNFEICIIYPFHPVRIWIWFSSQPKVMNSILRNNNRVYYQGGKVHNWLLYLTCIWKNAAPSPLLRFVNNTFILWFNCFLQGKRGSSSGRKTGSWEVGCSKGNRRVGKRCHGECLNAWTLIRSCQPRIRSSAVTYIGSQKKKTSVDIVYWGDVRDFFFLKTIYVRVFFFFFGSDM